MRFLAETANQIWGDSILETQNYATMGKICKTTNFHTKNTKSSESEDIPIVFF